MFSNRQEKLLSVIVPIYNTRAYLPKCLTSIQNQTYRDLEILCIDDGSTDGSGAVADEFARQDSRFIVKHVKNGGEASARNVGLRLASGEYITFVDSDDWIDKEMYRDLMDRLERNNADISACAYSMDTEQGVEPAVNAEPVKPGVWSRDELLRYVYHRDAYRAVSAYVWCKLYRRGILQQPDGAMTLFHEDLKICTDVVYFAEAALKAMRTVYTDKPYYHYYQRESSAIHSQNAENWWNSVEAYLIIRDKMAGHNVPQDILNWVERFLAYRAEVAAQVAYRAKNSEILQKCQAIMWEYEDVYTRTNQQYPERLRLYREVLTYSIGS